MSEEKYYRIKASTLTGIADFIRQMTGRKTQYTPVEMLSALGAISYIPQGWASSEFSPYFGANASGILPNVVKSMASSELDLDFATSAVGELVVSES